MLRCRVDDRLLHSEVLYAELPAGGFEQLVLAARGSQVALVEPSLVPAPTRVAVVEPSAAAGLVGPGATLVVVGRVSDLVDALEAGLEPDVVALANAARRGASLALSATFWIDASERRALVELVDRGRPPIVVQRVPSEPARPLTSAALYALGDQPLP